MNQYPQRRWGVDQGQRLPNIYTRRGGERERRPSMKDGGCWLNLVHRRVSDGVGARNRWKCATTSHLGSNTHARPSLCSWIRSSPMLSLSLFALFCCMSLKDISGEGEGEKPHWTTSAKDCGRHSRSCYISTHTHTHTESLPEFWRHSARSRGLPFE